MLVDTSGMLLDKKLTALLYVDDEEYDVMDEDDILPPEEAPPEGFEEAHEEVFGEKNSAGPTQEEVMKALEEIYGR